MKGQNKSLIWMLSVLFVLALNLPVNAQDDLYYDPSTDTRPVQTYEDNNDENNVTRRYDGDDDDEYYEEDDYAYEYSSRIRRFHRPAQVVDYYDPFFVDLYFYDPFFLPGASIYTFGYNDYWAWRRWQRWQRWNSWNSWNYGWGMGWNSWGWGGGYYNSWNAWNNPCVFNNYYYDPYWTWNGYNPYYGNVWVNNNYYYNNNNGGGGGNGYRPQTYTGPRRGGTQVNPGYARLSNGTSQNGRLVAIDKEAPVINIARPNGRTTVTEKQKDTPVERATPSTSGSRRPTTAKDPAVNTGRDRNTDQPTERTRPGSGETRPSRNDDVTPSRRNEERPAETRKPRTEERRPATRNEDNQRTRQGGSETRPSRSGGNEEARPSRPSSLDRPTRSGGSESRSGSSETRPSRSEGSSRSWDSGRSSSGSSGNSSGSKSSGSSGGGGSKSSGGGSRGRN